MNGTKTKTRSSKPAKRSVIPTTRTPTIPTPRELGHPRLTTRMASDGALTSDTSRNHDIASIYRSAPIVWYIACCSTAIEPLALKSNPAANCSMSTAIRSFCPLARCARLRYSCSLASVPPTTSTK